MNSRSERTASSPTMEELKARQQTALQANMSKATNLQKSVMLTESNWTGLTNAVELTGQAVIKLQETAEQLITAQQMDEKLSAQVSSLLEQHNEAIQEMRNAVRELTAVNAKSLEQMRKAMTDTVNSTKWQMECELKDFKSQVGSASGYYSSQISQATDSLRESANTMHLQMYLPTIILVLWELVRHLFLRG